MILRSWLYALLSLFFVGAGDTHLAGRVADSSGAQLPGVTISVSQDGRDPVRVTTSDADGRFDVGPLRPGEYRVEARLQGFKTERAAVLVEQGRASAVTITLQLEEPTQDIVVCCCLPLIDSTVPQLRKYRLTVADSAGRPVAEAVVVASGRKTLELISGADGVVEFAGTEQDFVGVTARHDGFRSMSASLCCVGERGQLTLRTQKEVEPEKP